MESRKLNQMEKVEKGKGESKPKLVFLGSLSYHLITECYGQKSGKENEKRETDSMK